MSRRLLLVSHGIVALFGLYYSIYLLIINPETLFSVEHALSYHPTFDHFLFIFFKFLLISISSFFAYAALRFVLPFSSYYSFGQGLILLGLALIIGYLPLGIRIFLLMMGLFQSSVIVYHKFTLL
ncbi:hypothetical protein ACWOE3_01840 [Enterococcus dispar]|uniref:Uncharacterized protein n=1 Tax=Enterococcus dispar ATCC 51266 TaxID=1139219 RepID=S1NZ53_9ENTE|nr:hypothetical protein [Enterococcus dispar]EOT43151.1 hypothetical protein OMK_00504 [Enterococcus dispar ATCC 51266]EOW85401.1 hypothetical protein I569_00696 [Enterococcus dispar ATCC 51266]OJG40290.1 hypothetical protein RV01_GL000364 [Enterococcus dispar]